MAGIYIHIPFCKSRCNYCDFFSTTQVEDKSIFFKALKKEIQLRKNYLGDSHIDTVYFGGGTPSLLTVDELRLLFEELNNNFLINSSVEVTLECNPDDLTEEYLKDLYNSPVNRLSIGIQSFRFEDLKLMNRRHNSRQAISVVKMAQEVGFGNISIDLIYGIPDLGRRGWEYNLEAAFSLGVQHISAYHLTFHEGTVFNTWLKEGKIHELPEDESLEHFKMLRLKALENGFEHYEISNFSLPEFYSRHNSAYWHQEKYIGLGPSAHSYDLLTRQWNVSDLQKYYEGVEKGRDFFIVEHLSKNDRYNDYVLTSLRTKWGISLNYILEEFGSSYFDYANGIFRKYEETHFLEQNKDIVTLSEEGLFVSDKILTDLMMVEDE